MSVDDIFNAIPRIKFLDARQKILELFYTDTSKLSIEEENSCFYPQLAAWAKKHMPNATALQVIEQVFENFDPHVQKREAKILETHLNQLGSN